MVEKINLRERMMDIMKEENSVLYRKIIKLN
jgi:hypothetical protein